MCGVLDMDTDTDTDVDKDMVGVSVFLTGHIVPDGGWGSGVKVLAHGVHKFQIYPPTKDRRTMVPP